MSDINQYLTDEAVEKVRDELAEVAIGGGYYATPIAVDEAEELARMALEVVLPDITQQAKAEAWDEGYIAGHEDARAVQPAYPQPTHNPYERKDS